MSKKFQAAFAGLKVAVNDSSIRLQMIIGLLVIIGGFWISLTYEEWVWIILCVSGVVVSEIMNTCMERVCDLIQEDFDERIKVIKDLAAGGVLCMSLASLVVGILVLVRHLT